MHEAQGSLDSNRTEQVRALAKCFNRPALGFNWAFVRGLVKQILLTKKGLYQVTLKEAIWCSFPSPGYWNLGNAVLNVLRRGKQMKVISKGTVGSIVAGRENVREGELVEKRAKGKHTESSLLRVLKSKASCRRSPHSVSLSSIATQQEIAGAEKTRVSPTLTKQSLESKDKQRSSSSSSTFSSSSHSLVPSLLEASPSAPCRQGSKVRFHICS